MENQHVDNLVDAYALGALEADEVDAVERHLQQCAACQALAEAARRSAALLLTAVPQVAPPASLRERVLARVAQEHAAMARGASTAPAERAEDEAPVAEAVEAPAPPRSRLGRLLEALHNEPPQSGRAGALLRDLLADPHVVIWPTAATNDAPGASGRLIASPRRHDAVFVASGLRRPAAGKAYQVWLLRGGQPMPNVLFTVDRAGVGAGIVHADTPWGAFDTVAVTPEPTAGSAAPTGPIVLAGTLVEQAG